MAHKIIAIKIVYSVFHDKSMAELKMNDGGIEHITWNNKNIQRLISEMQITPETIIYDERIKCPFNETI